MMTMRTSVPIGRVAVLALMALPGSAVGQEAWRPTHLDSAPVIDGVLDEAAWANAWSVDGFRTFQPDYGSSMLADTRVLMGYDEQNLYFGFIALDPEPDLIRASVTSRDNIFRDDWVAINLDSFGDAQTLNAFYINPYGIQGDSRLAGTTEDRGVDMVWYSAGEIDERGYTVEVQIPLSSIRFQDGDRVNMGVIFERKISRNSQSGTAPELDPARGGQWLTQMHPLEYDGIDNPRVFEVLPAATYTLDQGAAQGTFGTEYEAGEFSLTTKLGVTSDLVLDATYNPDFSQIEADAGQVDVNLRSDIFFPEKRPFFLEGREHFGFAATGGLNPVRSIIYTRRIVDPIGGGRLSGKVGQSHTLASIYAVDELDPGIDGSAEYARVPIVRYKRSLSEDSYVGAIVAGRETSVRSNRLAGLDGQIRLGQSAQLGMHALRTRTRPDLASPATEDGHALALRVASSTRRFDWNVEGMDISESYQSDVGFLTRDGIFRGAGLFRVRFFPDIAHVRRIELDVMSAQTLDRPSGIWESTTRFGFANHVFGSLNFRGNVEVGTEVYLGREFDDDGLTMTLGGLLANKGAFGVTYAAGTQPIYTSDPYQGRSRSLSAVLGLQPSSHFDVEIRFNSVDYYTEADSEKVFDVDLLRLRTTFQPNRYLLFRAIAEYNWFHEELVSDLLASFTYIPGTVIHVGYGSLHDRTEWDGTQYIDGTDFLETKRRFFFKTSYLFRN